MGEQAGHAVVALSAATVVCAIALIVMTPHPANSVLSSSSLFSSATSSTFLLPTAAAPDKYALDLENMQMTLQQDSLKPAGVMGDAANMLTELGDG